MISFTRCYICQTLYKYTVGVEEKRMDICPHCSEIIDFTLEAFETQDEYENQKKVD